MLTYPQDEFVNRKLLAKRFELDGHIVTECASGVDAVELFRAGEHAFDCVLMDIQ